jgi:hypothetical protein
MVITEEAWNRNESFEHAGIGGSVYRAHVWNTASLSPLHLVYRALIMINDLYSWVQ